MSFSKFTVLVLFFLAVAAQRAFCQGSDKLLETAAEALQAGKTAEALLLVNKALAKDAKNTSCLDFRATVFDKLEQYDKAVGDYDALIDLEPKSAASYNLRGMVQFKRGKIAESIKDFDRFIELKPNQKASHWQRGISYYYAGRFDEGRRQFEGYQDFDSNDVENAVWRFMCMAKAESIAKARAAILKIGDDKRVPMRQVYDLFAGKLKPDDVIAAARAGQPAPGPLNRQLFYAHLYVGIYYDLEGDRKTAFTHLNKATTEHRIGHYMWDVARVHRDLLKKEMDKK